MLGLKLIHVSKIDPCGGAGVDDEDDEDDGWWNSLPDVFPVNLCQSHYLLSFLTPIT